MIKWDVATDPVPSGRWLTMHGKNVVFEVMEHSYIARTSKTRAGRRTVMLAQGIVQWLRAKVLNGIADGKLLCAMDDVEMPAPED